MNKLLLYFKNLINKHYTITISTLSILTILLYIAAFVWIFYYLPDDDVQGSLVKIMYIHVPCAWLSLLIYILLGVVAAMYLIYNNMLANMAIDCLLAVCLNVCFLTLGTGMIWGHAAWGTWWAWDPRLTAVFIQFCILCICYVVRNLYANNNRELLSKISAMVIILGLINIPIVKFAVNAWNSIHQDSTFFTAEGPKIDDEMLYPLMISFAGITFFYLTCGLIIFKNKLENLKQLRQNLYDKTQ